MPPRSDSGADTEHRIVPLPLAHPGGRTALTCRYRCGDACAHPAPNTSGNPYLGDVIARALSRRSLLRAGAVVTVAAAATGGALAAPAAATPGHGQRPPRGLRFDPVAPNKADAVVTPSGYTQDVVIRWGDPILPGVPAFDPNAQSAAAQAGQFGYNCDYLALLDLPWECDRKVLVANHEYTDENLMHAGYDAASPTRAQVEIAWAAHGLSVVVLDEDRGGRLRPVRHRLNRRITATTPITLTGRRMSSRTLARARCTWR